MGIGPRHCPTGCGKTLRYGVVWHFHPRHNFSCPTTPGSRRNLLTHRCYNTFRSKNKRGVCSASLLPAIRRLALPRVCYEFQTIVLTRLRAKACRCRNFKVVTSRSSSLASPRKRAAQAERRSTTQRRGSSTKPRLHEMPDHASSRPCC